MTLTYDDHPDAEVLISEKSFTNLSDATYQAALFIHKHGFPDDGPQTLHIKVNSALPILVTP